MITDGYRAATERAAVAMRPDRRLLYLSGRAPGRMLTGMVTGRMPPPLQEVAPGRLSGSAPCSVMLTPKGRMVTDLRVARVGNGEDGTLLLDFPGAGMEAARAHMARYLPPRFARLEDPEARLAILSVVGPSAYELLSRELSAMELEPSALARMAEGEERVSAGDDPARMRLIRNGDVSPPAFDLIATESTLRPLLEGFLEGSAVPLDIATLETLRIERGRPAFGVELDEETLPPEAGLQRRCFDDAKGCYTGQEVIVRIRDRGHVNRRLRGLLLGEAPIPAPRTPLFAEGRTQPIGEIRSATRSPGFGQTIGLGYVRREVDPPGVVRLAAEDGPVVQVRSLDDEGWVLVEDDPPLYR